MDINDPLATIEGGDVLFTGREFFVGLSKTTNLAGAKAVASAFPEYPVTLLRVSIDILHRIKLFSFNSGEERCTFEELHLNGWTGYYGDWRIGYR